MPPPTTAERAAILHAELLPEAQAAFSRYIQQRTPHELYADMAPLIAADLDLPIDYALTETLIADGASIVVHDDGGGVNAKSPGTATVANHVLTAVTLSP